MHFPQLWEKKYLKLASYSAQYNIVTSQETFFSPCITLVA